MKDYKTIVKEYAEKFIVENPQGIGVTETRFRCKVGADDCHYSRNMLAASDVMKFVADMATDLSLRRDADSSMLANINADFHASLFGGDTVEVIGWVIEEGNRSRTNGFAIYKLISYYADHWDRRQDKVSAYTVLDKPELVCSGTYVCVVKKSRK
jgi:acyl-coenzyme A thioesterase PaaI-like protein